MTAVLPITVRDLSFRPGGRIVLDRLDATITSAGITALIGPNGAGKSVTLRIIDGLLQPDDGTIRFGNRLFAALWSAQHVQSVEVTWDEQVALEDRAATGLRLLGRRLARSAQMLTGCR